MGEERKGNGLWGKVRYVRKINTNGGEARESAGVTSDDGRNRGGGGGGGKG